MMTLPNIVVHAMDAFSPLVPHPIDLQLWREPQAPLTKDTAAYNPATDWRFPDPPQRSVDCDQGSRTHITCGFCGSSFWCGTTCSCSSTLVTVLCLTALSEFVLPIPCRRNRMQLEQHMSYCSVSDRTSGYDLSLMCKTCGEQFGSAQALRRHIESSDSCDAQQQQGCGGQNDTERRERSDYGNSCHKIGAGHQESVEGDSPYDSREMIEAWLKDTQAEIIVLVEGVDPTTSATIQSRHS
eukprot:COSAG02_NODE_1865_length_10601_cov_116.823748_10_plen_240_part_00